MDPNIRDYLCQILFDDSEEVDSSSAVMPPPLADETNPEATMTVEQFIHYLEVYAVADGANVDNSAGQHEGSSSMGQNTFNPPIQASSETIPTTAEGTIQNANYPDILVNQGENALVFVAAQEGISLNEGNSTMFAPNYGIPHISMLPGSQEIPQGSQLDHQFSVPPIEYNSSANIYLMPESSSIALGSQQQLDFQQPHQASNLSSSMETIPILVKHASMSTPCIGATSQYPSFPTQGVGSNNQAPFQNFSWPSQQLLPASSSCTPQGQAVGTYQGLSLGTSTNPGRLFLGSREIDLSSWSSTSPAPNELSSTNASSLATGTTSSSTNSRKRKATWEAETTAIQRLLDFAPQNDHNLLQNLTNQMPTQNHSSDPHNTDIGQFVDPNLRHSEASLELQPADNNFPSTPDGSIWKA